LKFAKTRFLILDRLLVLCYSLLRMNFQNLSQEDLSRIAQRLRDHGYRVTPQRMAIVEALYTSSHPTAEEIHRQIRERFPMVSLATVYKTLRMLVDLGIARDVRVGERNRFDGNIQPHAHLICVRCGQIADLPIDPKDAVPADRIEAQGFQVLWYDLEIYGVCRQCQVGKGPSAIS